MSEFGLVPFMTVITTILVMSFNTIHTQTAAVLKAKRTAESKYRQNSRKMMKRTSALGILVLLFTAAVAVYIGFIAAKQGPEVRTHGLFITIMALNSTVVVAGIAAFIICMVDIYKLHRFTAGK